MSFHRASQFLFQSGVTDKLFSESKTTYFFPGNTNITEHCCETFEIEIKIFILYLMKLIIFLDCEQRESATRIKLY